MDVAQGRKCGRIDSTLHGWERTNRKSITQPDNVTEDIRDLISTPKKEMGRKKLERTNGSQDGLHLGLKEQNNMFIDQEKGRTEATMSFREKAE